MHPAYRRLEAAEEAVAASRVCRPLAWAKLWDQSPPRTSQRRAFAKLGRLTTLVSGGNHSGKTEGGAMLSVAVAMGRDHPDVRAWLDANGLPDETVKNRGPGDVWAVSGTSDDSQEYVRPKVAKYLPPGCDWRNRYGQGQAQVTLPNGGRVTFKMVEQGRDRFQGTEKDLIWIDEEPDDRGVVMECLARLIDRGGRLLFTMTPLRGLTWMYDEYVAKLAADHRYHQIRGEDNPHIPQDVLESILCKYGPHEQEARRRGAWVALEGRVYEFHRHLHVVDGSRPNPEWPRYGGIDFGTRNPFCYLKAALDPKDDVLHIYAEHYRAEWLLSQHAEAIKAMDKGDPPPRWIVADPEDLGARRSLAAEHGIPTVKARKDVRDGINAVAERLAPDVEGRPHLVVYTTCPQVIREFESYVWDTVKSKRDAPDQPLKRNDHAMDTVRYLCLRLQRARSMGVSYVAG